LVIKSKLVFFFTISQIDIYKTQTARHTAATTLLDAPSSAFLVAGGAGLDGFFFGGVFGVFGVFGVEESSADAGFCVGDFASSGFSTGLEGAGASFSIFANLVANLPFLLPSPSRSLYMSY